MLAALSVVAFAFTTEFVPALAPLRVLSAPAPSEPTAPKVAPVKIETGEAELRHTSEQSDATAALAPAASAAFSDVPPKVEIESSDPNALVGFFRALEATREKRAHAITRIIHFGDSVVASDYVSGTLRRLLQSRFGDAGHGFTLIANAWPAYFHNDVERYATAFVAFVRRYAVI